MARKQSSTIWYQGNPHKEIYFQGHYHDKMYKGSQLVWEKLDNEYATNKFHRIHDYSTWNGITYCIISIYNYDESTRTATFEDTYIGKFNTEKMCIDVLLSGFLTGDPYDSYYIHACADGLVLTEYDSNFSNTNMSNKPILRIASYPISSKTKFKEIEKNTFSADTLIYMPPWQRNSIYCDREYVVFGSDYIVQEVPYTHSDGSIRAAIAKYDYDGNLMAQTTPTDYAVDGSRQTTLKNVFPIDGSYLSYTTTYNNRNTSMENIIGRLADSDLLSVTKLIITPGEDDYYQSLYSSQATSELYKKRVMANREKEIIFSANIYPKGGSSTPYTTARAYIGNKEGIKRVDSDTIPTFFVPMKNCIFSVNDSLRIIDIIKENEVKRISTYLGDETRTKAWFAEDDDNYYVITEGYDGYRSDNGQILGIDKETLEVISQNPDRIRYINR